MSEICTGCSGSGEGMYDGTRCIYCKGSGEVSTEEDDEPEDSREDYEYERYRQRKEDNEI